MLVKDFDAEVNIYPHAVLGDTLYFSAGDAEPGIWKTTGTAATTTRVVGPEYSTPPYMFAHGNALYFKATVQAEAVIRFTSMTRFQFDDHAGSLSVGHIGSGLGRLGFYGWLALLSGWE